MWSFPLRAHIDFLHQSLQIRGQFVDLFLHKGASTNTRLAGIVGKNVSLKACTRNYYKRILRENIRLTTQNLTPIDVVVRAKKTITTGSFLEIQHEIKQLLAKI